MKKRWMSAAVLGLFLSVAAVMPVAADEPNAGSAQDEGKEAGVHNAGGGTQEDSLQTGGIKEEKGFWSQDGTGWRYYGEDGAFKKNSWDKIGRYWYYFSRDGYMATGWIKIGGYNYCFRDTGDLAIGWCYNDAVSKWYNFNQDGTMKKGWFQEEDGSWYWFSSRGEMTSSGYKTIDGNRYYFFDSGQMAANQYIGLMYLDANGLRDKRYDIIIEGKGRDSSVPSEIKDGITEALEKIPRGWIQYFVEHGWEILYYPDKEYFSAPETDGGIYYVYHKLDTSYRKIKFCRPEELTDAFGEYIGYAADCFNSDSQFAVELAMNKGNVDEFVDIPSYYSDNISFCFGKLVAAYLSDSDTRAAMESDSPQVCRILKKAIYAR